MSNDTTMVKLNLNKMLLGLDGKDHSSKDEDRLAKILATRLSYSNKGEAVKLFDWSMSLWKDGEILVDKADLDFLVNFVKEDEQMYNFVKAQIIAVLKKSKDK